MPVPPPTLSWIHGGGRRPKASSRETSYLEVVTGEVRDTARRARCARAAKRVASSSARPSTLPTLRQSIRLTPTKELLSDTVAAPRPWPMRRRAAKLYDSFVRGTPWAFSATYWPRFFLPTILRSSRPRHQRQQRRRQTLARHQRREPPPQCRCLRSM